MCGEFGFLCSFCFVFVGLFLEHAFTQVTGTNKILLITKYQKFFFAQVLCHEEKPQTTPKTMSNSIYSGLEATKL